MSKPNPHYTRFFHSTQTRERGTETRSRFNDLNEDHESLNDEFVKIEIKYKNRLISSSVYENIYFSACFYKTLFNDIKYLYENQVDSSHVVRHKEVKTFKKPLLALFKRSVLLLERTREFHRVIVFNRRLPQQKYTRNDSDWVTYKDCMNESEELRYRIEGIVYQWREKLKYELSYFFKRPTNLIPKNYFFPNPKLYNLKYFTQALIKIQEEKGDNEQLAMELFNIFNDWAESGESLSGVIADHFVNLFRNNKYLKSLYLKSNKCQEEQPIMNYIGPFKRHVIRNLDQIFEITTSEPPNIGSQCHVVLKYKDATFLLNSANLTNVTLNNEEKEANQISKAASYFCYVYPCISARARKRRNEETIIDHLMLFGGYLYFNEERTEIVQAFAIEDMNRVYEMTDKDVFLFSLPFKLKPSKYDARKFVFHKCNFTSIESYSSNYKRYAWVNPGELGFANDGCFIFENDKGEVIYFNLLEIALGQIVFVSLTATGADNYWEHIFENSKDSKYKNYVM